MWAGLASGITTSSSSVASQFLGGSVAATRNSVASHIISQDVLSAPGLGITTSYTIDTSPIGYFIALDYFVVLQ